MNKRLIERFIKYTKVNTQSAPDTGRTPSTPGQMELARIVAEDLKEAGVQDVELTEEAFIYGTIPSNLDGRAGAEPALSKPVVRPLDRLGTQQAHHERVALSEPVVRQAHHERKAHHERVEGSRSGPPVIGLLAHLDTANEAPGQDVKARFIENYQGGDITFPADPELKLTPKINPLLKKCIGHTIITSDGTTLLGGDDKAGLAVLVELAHHLKENPKARHGKVRIAIIPDEEIAVGAEKLDLKKFGADIAYTVDGGEIGEIDVESFNGSSGKIEVEGYAAFPGYGKDVYLNAIQVISKFIARMNDEMWPQNCEGREPIWWIQGIKGEVSRAEAAVYLRDFDLEGIEKQKKLLEKIRTDVLKEFPKAKINIEINESYKNYKFELDKDPRVVRYAEEAMRRIGIKPRQNYVRGGNDSCHLCFNGLLSTNLFVGMQNMHSLMEWISVPSIEAAVKNLVSLVQVWAESESGSRTLQGA